MEVTIFILDRLDLANCEALPGREVKEPFVDCVVLIARHQELLQDVCDSANLLMTIMSIEDVAQKTVLNTLVWMTVEREEMSM